LKYILEM